MNTINKTSKIEYQYYFRNGDVESGHNLSRITNIAEAVEYMTGIWRGRATIEAQSSAPAFAVLSIELSCGSIMLCLVTSINRRG